MYTRKVTRKRLYILYIPGHVPGYFWPCVRLRMYYSKVQHALVIFERQNTFDSLCNCTTSSLIIYHSHDIKRSNARRAVFWFIRRAKDLLQTYVSPNPPHVQLKKNSTYLQLSTSSPRKATFSCFLFFSFAFGVVCRRRWNNELSVIFRA